MEREISYKTIIFTVLFLIFLWLLYQIRSLLLLFFIVVVLTTALAPIVEWLEKYRIPRILSILLIYFLFIGGIVATFYEIIPSMVDQSVAFFNSLPQILKETGLINSITPDMLAPELTTIPGSVFKFLLGLFSNLLGIFTILVLTFYFLMEKDKLPNHLHTLFEDEKKEKIAKNILDKIEKNIGGWVRGEILLMFIIGLFSYIGYRILGLEYAVALAVLAGFLEIVPNIGPVISAIPAILVGLSMSPALALGALILSVAVHQFENHIIVPQVMKHVIGMNPIVTIFCLLIGFNLGGAGGAILAIPAFLTLRNLLVEIYLLKSKSSPEKENP